jgi:hypothetical protein
VERAVSFSDLSLLNVNMLCKMSIQKLKLHQFSRKNMGSEIAESSQTSPAGRRVGTGHWLTSYLQQNLEYKTAPSVCVKHTKTEGNTTLERQQKSLLQWGEGEVKLSL